MFKLTVPLSQRTLLPHYKEHSANVLYENKRYLHWQSYQTDTYCTGEGVGPRDRYGLARKISPHRGSDPQTNQPVANRYTDYDISDASMYSNRSFYSFR